ncbi:MAG: hypothetical protein CMH59_25815, partial [Myxococcales bacterium]|nr:hypothetical protein [Myxococcales bacterium]
KVAADEGWRAAVWADPSSRDFVARVYERVAERDARLAFELDRARDALFGGNEARRALLEEGVGDAGAWLAMQLHGEQARRVAPLLLGGLDLGRPAAPLLPDALRPQLVPFLAGSPHEADRDLPAAELDTMPWPTRFHVACAMAGRSDARADGALGEALAAFADGAADRVGLDRDEHAFGALVRALGSRAESRAAPSWVEALARCLDHCLDEGPWAYLGLVTLATGEDDAGTEPLEARLHRWIDDTPETRAVRLGAALALAARGHAVGLEDARWALHELHLERYGWPKADDVVLVRRLAGELLLRVADDDARRQVASWATAPFWLLREIADRAREELGLGPLARTWYDPARVRRTRAEAGPEGLLAALEEEGAVFLDPIVEALAEGLEEGEDAELRRRLAAWCRARLEGQRNHYLQYADDVPADSKKALRFLQALDEDEKEAWLGDTTSAWIRAFVLDEGDLERARPEEAPPEGVRVRRFDAAPFVVGAHVNGLALSPDGATLCAVGQEAARLLDARGGAAIGGLELRWNWGYDCAFAPDGARVAACFHGGHVELYDAASGERVRELQGHGGVPTGTRCLAFAPDGATLVSGGGDGRLIAWDVASGEARWVHEGGPGSYQDVAFLPDGRVLASHVKTSGGEANFLEVLDPASGAAERHDVDASMWALAVDGAGRLALGGEAKSVRVGRWTERGFEEERRLPLAKVTRLEWDGARLWATSEEGALICFEDLDAEDGAPRAFVEEGPPLWALALGAGRAFAAGTAGEVIVVEGDARVEPEGARHATRVVDAVELPDGRILSLDWDGHLLAWPATGGVAEEVAALGVTGESLALVDGPEPAALCGTRDGLRLVRVRDGALLAETDARADHVAVDAAADLAGTGGATPDGATPDGPTVAWSSDEALAFARLPDLAPVGEPVEVGSDDVNALCAAPGGGFLAGSEAGELAFVKEGAEVWRKADHGADRLERGNPHRDVCSVVAAPGGERVASGATDHVVRVYRWPEATPELRIACGFGLFNRLAFDPSGRLLAIPSSGRLELWDLDARRRRWVLPFGAFESHELMGVGFLRDGRLLVRTKSGGLFTVTDGEPAGDGERGAGRAAVEGMEREGVR